MIVDAEAEALIADLRRQLENKTRERNACAAEMDRQIRISSELLDALDRLEATLVNGYTSHREQAVRRGARSLLEDHGRRPRSAAKPWTDRT